MILIRGNVEREADGAIAEKLMKDGFRPLEEEGAAEAVPSETVEKNLDEMTVDELKTLIIVWQKNRRLKNLQS